MRHPSQLLLFLLLSVSVRAADPATMIADSEIQDLGFRKQWEASLPVPAGCDIDAAYLVDEALYVTAEDGSVFALQADVGLLRWADHLTEPDYTIFRPTHVRTRDGKGPTLIPTTTRTFYYDRYSGARLSSFEPPFPPGGPMIAVDRSVFAGSVDGRFYALIMAAQTDLSYKAWEVSTGGPITAAPILFDGNKLLFASQGGRVFACLAEDKTYLWSFATEGAIIGDPAVDPSGAYVASEDRSLYKLDTLGGQRLWRVRFPAPLREGPAVAAQTVYQYCEDDGLTALDAGSGDRKWRLEDGRMFVSHSTAGDVILTEDCRFRIVESNSGATQGIFTLPDALGAVTNPRDDAVFVWGSQGRIACLRLDNVPYLRRQQVLSARQQLNMPPAKESASQSPNDKPPAKPRTERDKNPFRSDRDQP